MILSEQVAKDLIAAMKAKEATKLDALRAMKTAFTLAKSEKGSGSSLTDEEEIKIVQRLVKQRLESANIYKQQNRQDLADKEEAEANVLQQYLPAKMDAAEIEKVVASIIENVGATTIKDLGKVMGTATKQLAGKADGKEIMEIVKKLLS